MPTLSKKVVKGLLLAILVYLGAGTGLSGWPAPGFSTTADASPEAARAQGLSLEQVYPFEEREFAVRDGERLFARRFPAENPALTLLVVHGMTTDSSFFNRTAGLLRAATGAEVYALDLRGHGRSGGRAGDVDHVGQYEEDLVDVVSALRAERPDSGLILCGHSMGGGIAQRYALLPDSPPVDGYLLFAPLLGPGAPTTRTDRPPETRGEEPWLRLAVPRIVGLFMLNAVGVKALNAQGTMFCHVSEGARVAAYTFRAMLSVAPNDYVAGIAAIDAPLLVIVGSEDEAFHPDEYAPLVAAHSQGRGRVEVVDGCNHNGVHHDVRAIALAEEWIFGLGLGQ